MAATSPPTWHSFGPTAPTEGGSHSQVSASTPQVDVLLVGLSALDRQLRCCHNRNRNRRPEFQA